MLQLPVLMNPIVSAGPVGLDRLGDGPPVGNKPCPRGGPLQAGASGCVDEKKGDLDGSMGGNGRRWRPGGHENKSWVHTSPRRPLGPDGRQSVGHPQSQSFPTFRARILEAADSPGLPRSLDLLKQRLSNPQSSCTFRTPRRFLSQASSWACSFTHQALPPTYHPALPLGRLTLCFLISGFNTLNSVRFNNVI